MLHFEGVKTHLFVFHGDFKVSQMNLFPEHVHRVSLLLMLYMLTRLCAR